MKLLERQLQVAEERCRENAMNASEKSSENSRLQGALTQQTKVNKKFAFLFCIEATPLGVQSAVPHGQVKRLFAPWFGWQRDTTCCQSVLWGFIFLFILALWLFLFSYHFFPSGVVEDGKSVLQVVHTAPSYTSTSVNAVSANVKSRYIKSCKNSSLGCLLLWSPSSTLQISIIFIWSFA